MFFSFLILLERPNLASREKGIIALELPHQPQLVVSSAGQNVYTSERRDEPQQKMTFYNHIIVPIFYVCKTILHSRLCEGLLLVSVAAFWLKGEGEDVSSDIHEIVTASGQLIGSNVRSQTGSTFN